nr:unnamed protein product [Callosobruchus chinensis]
MLLLSRLRLITFDVTGTLLQFRRTIPEQYGQVGAFYGIQVDRGKLAGNFKKHWERMVNEHPNFGLKTGLGWENWWKTLVKDTFKDSNITVTDFDDRMLDAVASHLIEAYKNQSCWQHSHGVLDLLSYIKSRGITIGVISNFDPRLGETLQNLKLRHYFQFVMTSYETQIEKPDSRIFEEAKRLSKLKDLCSDECLHVGDNPRIDYLGAKDAGWQAALILEDQKRETTITKHPDIDPTHVFPSLFEMVRHFMDKSKNDVISSRL